MGNDVRNVVKRNVKCGEILKGTVKGIASGIVGLSMAGVVSAATNMSMNISSDAMALISGGSPICGLISLLTIGGGVAMTSGVLMAAYHYMSADQDARQKAKMGAEGIMIGGGLVALAPTLVKYIFGFNVC